MHAKDTLDELTQTLIATRDKAVVEDGFLQVLPHPERNLLKRQIESCIQALLLLTVNLDPAVSYDRQRPRTASQRLGCSRIDFILG